MVRTSRLATFTLAVLLVCATQLHAAKVTVAWDPNPEANVTYVVYWGSQSQTYTSSAAAGTNLSYVVDGLGAGRTYYFAVQAVSSDGLASPFSEEVSATTPSTEVAVLAASPSLLKFAAIKAGSKGSLTAVTSPQTVTISMSGGTTGWTARADKAWVQITNGSANGAGQFTVSIINPGNVIGGSKSLSATITITPDAAGASPITVPVSLTVNQTGKPKTGSAGLPFGQVDTPLQGAADQVGTIGVTGWVLDDVSVSAVKIYRNCLAFDAKSSCKTVGGYSVVYLGDATFLAGARPDVEAAYANYPLSYRGGWGYLLLTNMLPHVANAQAFGGQGRIKLYAFATDADGHTTLLGRSYRDKTPTTITLANDRIDVPFGAIDTPGQGETVSGTVANFGWALTPDTDGVADPSDIYIPTDGSTMAVFIDGVAQGNVAYNQCRGTVGNPVPEGVYCDDDISSVFGNATPKPAFTPRSENPRRFRNLDAGRSAIGAFDIDTTKLADGRHTIAWSVTDSAGRTAGIGSRFFTVMNAAAQVSGDMRGDATEGTVSLADAPAQVRGDAAILAGYGYALGEVMGRTGTDLQAEYEPVGVGHDGVRRVQLDELGRLELSLGSAVDAGYLVANGTLRDLPPGSHLDAANGVFTWAPGVGYIGAYDLAFLRGAEQVRVVVTIRAAVRAAKGQSEVRMSLDQPRTGQTVGGTFTVAGWALDPQASIGSGIGALHVWAQRRDVAGASAVFLGVAELNGSRPDVAGVYGDQFASSGFSLETAALPAGQYDVTAYAWNRRTGRFEDARTVRVNVR